MTVTHHHCHVQSGNSSLMPEWLDHGNWAHMTVYLHNTKHLQSQSAQHTANGSLGSTVCSENWCKSKTGMTCMPVWNEMNVGERVRFILQRGYYNSLVNAQYLIYWYIKVGNSTSRHSVHLVFRSEVTHCLCLNDLSTYGVSSRVSLDLDLDTWHTRGQLKDNENKTN